MKKRIISIILALCCFIPAAASAGTVNNAKKTYLPGAFVLLPAKTKMKFEWVMAPVDEKEARSTGDINAQFSVDGAGKPWLSRNNNMLADMADGFVLKTQTQFKGFTFLDSGMFYLTDGKYLDFIAGTDKKDAGKGAIIDVKLQPLASLPVPGCSIFPGRETYFIYAAMTTGTAPTMSMCSAEKAAS